MNRIEGLGFSCFRSIGKDPVFLYPFSKINLFVGPNNSGKSNILKCIEKWCETDLGQKDDDYPKYDRSLVYRTYKVVHVDATNNLLIPKTQQYAFLIGEIKRIITSKLFNYDSDQGILWYEGVPSEQELQDSSSNISPLSLMRYSMDYTGFSDGSDFVSNGKNLQNIFNKFFSVSLASYPKIDKCIYIKANRDLHDNSKNNFLDDEKIIDKLNKTINHNASDTQAEKDKQAYEKFVSGFIGRKVRVSIPASLDSIILVSEDNPMEQYGLDQLGSGIHEILYFALVVTLTHNAVICIDEPEIHMHPRLQREFLEYLIENTDNQYFIATHSSAFINTDKNDVSVFSVFLNKDGFTECKFIEKLDQLSSLVDLLGCKASDIVQSNCVIWVEGPSDRLYINYWINGWMRRYQQDCRSLVEGIDYSVMFYGGRLLNHLSGNDDIIDEDLISLLRINRNSFVVIDSDKKNSEDSINSTKKRIITEFGKRCWLTDGREIENYLDKEQYESIAKGMDDSFAFKKGDFSNLLKKGNGSLDKVDFAKRIIANYPEPCFDHLCLDKRIETLVEFIRKSNE